MSSKKESTATPEYIFDTKCKLNGLCCKIFMAQHNTYLPHKGNSEYVTIGEARFCNNILYYFSTEHNNEEENWQLLYQFERKMRISERKECCILETAYNLAGNYNHDLNTFFRNNGYTLKPLNGDIENERQWCKNLNTTE